MTASDRQRPSGLRAALLRVLALGVGLLVAEIALSAALIYRHRSTGAVHDGVSRLSLLVLAERALASVGLAPPPSRYRLARVVEPDAFFRPDSVYGYVAAPGTYRHIYRRQERRRGAAWEELPVDVRINADGSRWTGRDVLPGRPTIWLLGDSFVFGSGVHDAQTFGFLLQGLRPQANVRLFALGGYGLAQSYIRVRAMADSMRPDDIVVVGYADYYDVRNVAAPSRLRDIAEWNEATRGAAGSYRAVPKVSLGADGRPVVTLISEDCRALGAYCSQPDPPASELADIAAALINGIAATTPAERVVLLVMEGRRDNPVYAKLDRRVTVLWARPEDFAEFVRDDIEGFDTHPGPFWHYAIARLLDARLGH